MIENVLVPIVKIRGVDNRYTSVIILLWTHPTSAGLQLYVLLFFTGDDFDLFLNADKIR